MTPLRRLAALLIVLPVITGCRNQPPEGAAGAQRVPVSGFIQRSLAETVASAAFPADAPPGPITVPGDRRSISRVIYVGTVRPVPDARRGALRFAEKRTGTISLSDEVKNELLFREGETDHWMPVGARTEPGFKTLRAGQTIDLYATLVAAVKSSAGQLDPVFVAQEYLETQ